MCVDNAAMRMRNIKTDREIRSELPNYLASSIWLLGKIRNCIFLQKWKSIHNVSRYFLIISRNTLLIKPALEQIVSRIGTLTYDNSFCPSALRKTTESVIFHTRRKGKRDECAFRNSISFLTLYDFAGSICLHALSYKHIPYLNSNTIRTTFNPPVGFKHEMPSNIHFFCHQRIQFWK